MAINKINVNGTSYDIVDTDTITSVNGKTGAILASDIAAVLNGAGYNLNPQQNVLNATFTPDEEGGTVGGLAITMS